eukprot:329259-Chlamydomonas_euryale.AAC.12
MPEWPIANQYPKWKESCQGQTLRSLQEDLNTLRVLPGGGGQLDCTHNRQVRARPLPSHACTAPHILLTLGRLRALHAQRPDRLPQERHLVARGRLCVARALLPRARHGQRHVRGNKQAHDGGGRRQPPRVAEPVRRACVTNVDAEVHRHPRQQDRPAAKHVLLVVRRRPYKAHHELQHREAHDERAEHLVRLAGHAAGGLQPDARKKLPRKRKPDDKHRKARHLEAHVQPEPHLLAAHHSLGGGEPAVAREQRANRQQHQPCDAHEHCVDVQLLLPREPRRAARAARAQVDGQRTVDAVHHVERVLLRANRVDQPAREADDRARHAGRGCLRDRDKVGPRCRVVGPHVEVIAFGDAPCTCHRDAAVRDPPHRQVRVEHAAGRAGEADAQHARALRGDRKVEHAVAGQPGRRPRAVVGGHRAGRGPVEDDASRLCRCRAGVAKKRSWTRRLVAWRRRRGVGLVLWRCRRGVGLVLWRSGRGGRVGHARVYGALRVDRERGGELPERRILVV